MALIMRKFDLTNIDENEIKILNKKLEKAGIKIERHTAAEAGCYSAIFLVLDEERWERETRRNAGRKPKAIKDKDGYLSSITMDEIKEKMQNMTAGEIAKELGISRRTLFRRIKLSTELGSREFL